MKAPVNVKLGARVSSRGISDFCAAMEHLRQAADSTGESVRKLVDAVYWETFREGLHRRTMTRLRGAS
jgi:hypothetical protein